MFYRFGLFSPLRQFSQPSPLLQFRTLHEAALRRGPAQKLRAPPNARTISSSAQLNPFNAISSKGLILTGCIGLGLTLSLKRTPIHCDGNHLILSNSIRTFDQFHSLPRKGRDTSKVCRIFQRCPSIWNKLLRTVVWNCCRRMRWHFCQERSQTCRDRIRGYLRFTAGRCKLFQAWHVSSNLNHQPNTYHSISIPCLSFALTGRGSEKVSRILSS